MYFDKLFFIFDKYIDKVFVEIKFSQLKNTMGREDRLDQLRDRLASGKPLIPNVRERFAKSLTELSLVQGPSATQLITKRLEEGLQIDNGFTYCDRSDLEV